MSKFIVFGAVFPGRANSRQLFVACLDDKFIPAELAAIYQFMEPFPPRLSGLLTDKETPTRRPSSQCNRRAASPNTIRISSAITARVD